MAYNVNPSPQSGTSAFGSVPGVVNLPDPFGDLNKAVGGGLGGANQLALGDIQSELGGNVTQGTMNALALAAAQRGVGGGMGRGGTAGLTTNDLFGNIAGFSENQVKQGFQDYNQTIPTISKTQTVDPALQTEIANRNANFAAAPNPTAAASYARQLYEEYLNKLRGGVSSTPRGGYTIVGSPAGGTVTPPRTPGIGGGGGGGGVGLPAGGFQPGDFETLFGDNGTGLPLSSGGVGLPAGGYYPIGESPTAPINYPGGTPPAQGGYDWTDPFGTMDSGQTGGADSITAPAGSDLASDFWEGF